MDFKTEIPDTKPATKPVQTDPNQSSQNQNPTNATTNTK
jgi:hypothetical protein